VSRIIVNHGPLLSVLHPVCTLRDRDVSIVKEFYAHFVFYARNFVAEILLRPKARFNIREAVGRDRGINASLAKRANESVTAVHREPEAGRAAVFHAAPRRQREEKSRVSGINSRTNHLGRPRIRFVSG